MTIEPRHRFSSMGYRVFEIAMYVFLGGICWMTTWLFIRDGAFEDYAMAALFVSLGAGLGPLLWPFSDEAKAKDNLSVLITMGFRFSVMLGALVISTATKWQHHNSFCNCLMGYYFPFLLLQSALLIRNQSLQHPSQS